MAITDKQKQLIELYIENPMVSLVHYGEQLGIRSGTVYNWKSGNINGFKDALDAALYEKWEKMKYIASQTMQNLAEEGDFKASQYILNYHGYQPTTKVEADVNAKITSINIDIKSEETEE